MADQEELLRLAHERVNENFDVARGLVGEPCTGALILALAAEVASLQETNDTMVRIANLRAEERDRIAREVINYARSKRYSANEAYDFWQDVRREFGVTDG